MPTNQERLEFLLSARDQNVNTTLNRVRGSLDKVNQVATLVARSTAAAGAALAATFAVRASYLDTLAKTADRLGATVEGLQALGLAGEKSGVTMQNLGLILQRQTRRVAEAAQGTGEAVSAINELGLSAENLNKLSPELAFQKIIAELEKIPNQSDKVRLAFKIFDSEGVKALNVTSDAINQATDDLERFGTTLTRLDLAKVEAANDQMLQIRRNITGAADLFTVQLAPAVTAVSNVILDMSAGLIGANKDSVDFGRTLIRSIGSVGDFFNNFLDGIGLIRLAINEVSRGMAEFIKFQLEALQSITDLIPGVGEKISGGIQNIIDTVNDDLLELLQKSAEIERGIADRFAQGAVSQRLEAYFNEAEAMAIKRAREIEAKAAAAAGGGVGRTVVIPDPAPTPGIVVPGIDQAAGSGSPADEISATTSEAEKLAQALNQVATVAGTMGNAISQGTGEAFNRFKSFQIAVASVAALAGSVATAMSPAVTAGGPLAVFSAYATVVAQMLSVIGAARQIQIGGSAGTAPAVGAGQAAIPNVNAPANAVTSPLQAQPDIDITIIGDSSSIFSLQNMVDLAEGLSRVTGTNIAPRVVSPT